VSRLVASLVLSLPVLSLAHEASAQTQVEPTFSVERFQSAPGPRNYLVTRGARTDGEKAWTAGLLLHYGYRPFSVKSCTTRTGESCSESMAQQVRTVRVVENLMTADLLGSFTIIPRLQLGARLPLSWVKGQGISTDGTPANKGLSAVGIGDFELEGKGRLYGEVDGPFVLGAAVGVTAPLGKLTAEDKYIGDKTPTLILRAIIDGQRGPISYAANLGGMFRGKADVGKTTLGSEARYSVGAGFKVSPVFKAMVDMFGSTRLSSTPGANTLELLGAVQAQPLTLPVAFTLGAGTSLVKGVGAPDVRAVLGFMYLMESKDDDNDGIENHLDQCPTEPEDKDGYEDSDGCPDKDNDLDSIPDAADKCPMQAEDADGFEDTDGCPDLDNDKDGLADTADQCPMGAETRNNYKDEDGCPDESDVDNDGVPDATDKCPTEAEDTDGFEDTDGCPDPDNDKDGILDDQDECIDEPETMNGFEDEDGCPDESAQDAKKKK
jgi:hypothetical protein